MTTTQTKYGVKEIAELFPPLMEIKDESLREKVAAVWNEAIAINNSVPQGLTSAIFTNVQSCRVDDARSTFATKCLYRMGI